MLVAAEVLHELRIPLSGDILFSTVVDEEIGGMGTLAMVDRGYHADAGILTEPTNNRISPVCHGIWLADSTHIKGFDFFSSSLSTRLEAIF